MLDADLHVFIGKDVELDHLEILMGIFKEIGVEWTTSFAPNILKKDVSVFAKKIKEKKIVFFGGIDLLESGLMKKIILANEDERRVFFAIPIEQSFGKALNNLPPGMIILSCGFNEENMEVGIVNNALAIVKTLIVYGYHKLVANFRTVRNRFRKLGLPGVVKQKAA